MVYRMLITAGRCVVQALAIVGLIALCLLFIPGLAARRQAPHVTGHIYDCRQGNTEACLAVWQLATQSNYAAEVHVYQYPNDDATMISLTTESQGMNFIILPTKVTVHNLNGKAPRKTLGNVRLVAN